MLTNHENHSYMFTKLVLDHGFKLEAANLISFKSYGLPLQKIAKASKKYLDSRIIRNEQ